MSSKEVLRHFWIPIKCNVICIWFVCYLHLVKCPPKKSETFLNPFQMQCYMYLICLLSAIGQMSSKEVWDISESLSNVMLYVSDFLCYLSSKEVWDISESLSNAMLYVSDLFVIWDWSNVLQRSLRHFWIPFKCNVICIWFVCYLRFVKCPPKKSETFLNPFQM